MEIEEAIWVRDPVKVALQLFGNTEDNRCLWGWYCKKLGRDEFRGLLYQKWRENQEDGMPRNPAAAFQRLLSKGPAEAYRRELIVVGVVFNHGFHGLVEGGFRQD